MTTYRSDIIRSIVLRKLAEVRGESRERYAAVVGTLTALLDDDPELVAAIDAACHGSQEEEKVS